jgi:hypothetical protein
MIEVTFETLRCRPYRLIDRGEDGIARFRHIRQHGTWARVGESFVELFVVRFGRLKSLSPPKKGLA